LFKGHDSTVAYHSYAAKTLEAGKYYSVKELLHYMIAYSDNEATILLLKHVRPEFHFKTYTDLGLPKPNAMTGLTEVSARGFSVFMNVIFNATYMNAAASEFCSSLLTECDFKEGLVKGLPASVNVAHKFGEFSDGVNYELHESGIVFNGDVPYVITVMTKGPDRKQLAEAIGDISAIVYHNIAGNKTL
jgi:beta-lactamase class A